MITIALPLLIFFRPFSLFRKCIQAKKVSMNNKNRFRTKFYAKLEMKLSFCIINRYETDFFSWTTLYHLSSLSFIDFVKCKRTCIFSCQACFFLFSFSSCQLSILDVFLFELFRNGSALLPLFIYLYVCVIQQVLVSR